MKKLFCILLACIMTAACMTACSSKHGSSRETSESGKSTGSAETVREADSPEKPAEDSAEAEVAPQGNPNQLFLDAITAALCTRSVVPLEEASIPGTTLEIDNVPEGETQATVFTVAFSVDQERYPEYRLSDLSTTVRVYTPGTSEDEIEAQTCPAYVCSTYCITSDSDYCLRRIVVAGDVPAEDLMLRIYYDWDNSVSRDLAMPAEESGLQEASGKFTAEEQPDLDSKIITISSRPYFIDMVGSIDTSMEGAADGREYFTCCHEYKLFPLSGSILPGITEDAFTVDVQKEVPGTTVTVSMETKDYQPNEISFLFEARYCMPDKEEYSDEDWDAADADINEALAGTYFRAADGSFSMRSAGTYGNY